MERPNSGLVALLQKGLQMETNPECIDVDNKMLEKLKDSGFDDWSEGNCLIELVQTMIPNCLLFKTDDCRSSKCKGDQVISRFKIKCYNFTI
jgi:hypothetical protein